MFFLASRKKLLKAAAAGEHRKVAALLRRNADMKAVNEYGSTALHLAAKNGHIEIVELLIAKGAEIDCRSKYDHTPMFDAAWKGHSTVVRLLLSSGANPDAQNSTNATALTGASIHGHTDVVSTLLDFGTNVNLSTFRGCTALYYAASHGHLEIVKMLLSHGANPEVSCHDKTTMSAWAEITSARDRKKYQEILECLKSKLPPSQTGTEKDIIQKLWGEWGQLMVEWLEEHCEGQWHLVGDFRGMERSTLEFMAPHYFRFSRDEERVAFKKWCKQTQDEIEQRVVIEPGIELVNLRSGIKYAGEIKGDVPHGRGVMRWFDATSGQHYYHIGHFEEGEFVDGKQICEGGSTSHIGGGFNWLERDFFERLRTAVDR